MNGKVYFGSGPQIKRLEHHEGKYYRIVAFTGLHDMGIVYPVGDGFLQVASLFNFENVKQQLDGIDPVEAFNKGLNTSLEKMAAGKLYPGWVYPVAMALGRMDEYERALASYRQVSQEREKEQQERKRILEAVRIEKQIKKQKEYMAALKSSVKEGKSVSGKELLELADAMDLSIHPRTKGAIKRWINSISLEKIMVDKKHQTVCASAFHLYETIKSQLTKGE